MKGLTPLDFCSNDEIKNIVLQMACQISQNNIDEDDGSSDGMKWLANHKQYTKVGC